MNTIVGSDWLVKDPHFKEFIERDTNNYIFDFDEFDSLLLKTYLISTKPNPKC